LPLSSASGLFSSRREAAKQRLFLTFSRNSPAYVVVRAASPQGITPVFEKAPRARHWQLPVFFEFFDGHKLSPLGRILLENPPCSLDGVFAIGAEGEVTAIVH